MRRAVIVLLTAVLLVLPASAMASPCAGITGLAPCEVSGPSTSSRAMIVVHGGGWLIVGPGAVAGVRPWADRYAARGWRVLNTDYTAGGTAGLRDVLALYDAMNARRPGRVCLMGQSAGGQLALMVAALRQPLCVIAQAGILDLTRSPLDLTFSFAPVDRLPNSPLLRAVDAYDGTRLLLAQCTADPYAPWSQALAFRDRFHPWVLWPLAPGTTGSFVHCSGATTADALRGYDAVEDTLLDGFE